MNKDYTISTCLSSKLTQIFYLLFVHFVDKSNIVYYCNIMLYRYR